MPSYKDQMYGTTTDEIVLAHHGVRRYQNPDGSLTAAGKERYLVKVEHVDPNEMRRRTENAITSQDQAARARKWAAKSEKNAKLAENSSGISKAIRQTKSKHEAKRAEVWRKREEKTNKMISITNNVYKKRISNGERIASELLLNDEFRNKYYMDRAKHSTAVSVGKQTVQILALGATAWGISKGLSYLN